VTAGGDTQTSVSRSQLQTNGQTSVTRSSLEETQTDVSNQTTAGDTHRHEFGEMPLKINVIIIQYFST